MSVVEHCEVLTRQRKRTAILLRKQKEIKICDSLLQPKKNETSDEEILILISKKYAAVPSCLISLQQCGEGAYSGIHVSSGNFNEEEGTWFKRKKDDICFTRERFLLTEVEFYFKLLMKMIIIIKLNFIIN